MRLHLSSGLKARLTALGNLRTFCIARRHVRRRGIPANSRYQCAVADIRAWLCEQAHSACHWSCGRFGVLSLICTHLSVLWQTFRMSHLV
jgi:hypothetical protein